MTDRRVARPQRTCIATRRTADAKEFLRVVVDVAASSDASRSAGRPVAVVVPDPGKVLPGRGASITPTEQAVAVAVKRRAFARALKTPASVDVSRVVAWVNDRGMDCDDHECEENLKK